MLSQFFTNYGLLEKFQGTKLYFCWFPIPENTQLLHNYENFMVWPNGMIFSTTFVKFGKEVFLRQSTLAVTRSFSQISVDPRGSLFLPHVAAQSGDAERSPPRSKSGPLSLLLCDFWGPGVLCWISCWLAGEKKRKSGRLLWEDLRSQS